MSESLKAYSIHRHHEGGEEREALDAEDHAGRLREGGGLAADMLAYQQRFTVKRITEGILRPTLSSWGPGAAVLASLGLFGAGIAAWWWPVHGARAVEQLKAELCVQGERFRLEELAPALGGGDASVNVLLQSLASRLEPLWEGDRHNRLGRGDERESRVAWQEERLDSWCGVKVDWERAEAILDAVGDDWGALENALRDPPANAGLGFGRGNTGTTSVWPIVTVARGLREKVLVEMHRGHYEAAGTSMVTLIKCGRYNREGLSLHEQLLRMMVVELGGEALWQVLQNHDWSDAELRQFQEEWAKVDIVSGIPAGLELDRIQSLAVLQALRDGAFPLPRAGGVYAADRPTNVIVTLARQADLSVTIAPGVAFEWRAPVTFRFDNVTARQVLKAVLKWNGLSLKQDRFTERYWVVDAT